MHDGSVVQNSLRFLRDFGPIRIRHAQLILLEISEYDLQLSFRKPSLIPQASGITAVFEPVESRFDCLCSDMADHLTDFVGAREQIAQDESSQEASCTSQENGLRSTCYLSRLERCRQGSNKLLRVFCILVCGGVWRCCHAIGMFA